MSAVLVAAPRYASMMAWDCHACGRAELGHVVFLSIDGSGPIAHGTHCAARALYGSSSAKLATRVRDGSLYLARIDRQNRLEAAEHAAAYRSALEEFHAGDDGPWSPARMSCTRSYHVAKRSNRIHPLTTVAEFFAEQIADYSARAGDAGSPPQT